jgi:cytochrome c
MGRPVVVAEGFLYSEAVEQADFTWNEDTLSAFLENPALNMPGTVMPFAGLKKPEQRLAVNCLLNCN